MTIAAWLVMAGSVFVVLTAFDQVAGLRSARDPGGRRGVPAHARRRGVRPGRAGDAQPDAGDDHGHRGLRHRGGDPGLPDPAPVRARHGSCSPCSRPALPGRCRRRRVPALDRGRLDRDALVPAGPGLDRRQDPAARPGATPTGCAASGARDPAADSRGPAARLPGLRGRGGPTAGAASRPGARPRAGSAAPRRTPPARPPGRARPP